MRSTKVRRNWIQMLWGALLGLYLAAPAYAFTPSDSPLLSAAAVTPNVMLLIDNSGSMNNIIWASGFDPSVAQVRTWGCSFSNNCNSIFELDMSDANVLLAGLSRGGCSNGWYGFYRSNLGRVCLRLPDPVGNGDTRYTAKYLSYLVTLANGSSRDYTTGSIPRDYRINVARDVSNDLVASNRALRIGLATFNPPNFSNSGPGGYIARGVSDLSAVSGSVTQTQANANYSALVNAINGLGAVANTPLAESYYEVTRYFRGMAPYHNSTPSTYTSPIQYRCQKNFGVVITDGLPTYDRTFPTNDPLGGSRLPNWDGISTNDGADLNGDAEGDTLYLDDIAKFAFDIDMRSTGTDATGQSWNATDFPRQYLNTYTVGFTATNQMLSDAARYGAGKYYQASDSEGLNSALSSALSDITSKAGSGGGGTTNGATLSTTSSYYQSTYDPKDWRGTIRAFGFTSAGTVDTAAVQWTTNTTIVPGAAAPTYQSWNTATNTPVTLAYGNFSPAQQTSLSQGLPTGITGNDLVEWSKGVNKTGLKVRSVLLGDIINSPLVLASPNDQTASDLLNDTSYSTYLATKAANMNTSLVVNANDGFFSVINSANGTRRYAYMPSSVLPSLRDIADTNYINGVSHKFLVDGQIGVFDAQLGSAWKTVALGGTGAGGKAFYAVQLFDAAAGNALRALWEISAPSVANTANAFNDLGYAYARPEVARLADGRWAAFIANGYGSNTGVAALYVVDIRDGSLIRKIIVNSSETGNGLSSVKLRVNSQNVVQAAYGGDLKGRMWKFDLNGTSPTTWGVAFAGQPLFTAPGGATQPITVQPLLADNPQGGTQVFFGTGKFNEAVDKLNKDLQGFYSIWDATGGTGQITVSSLQAQSITGVFSGSTGQFVTTSQTDVTYPAKKGWYLPLVYNNALTGERVINPASLVLGRIVFTTAAVDTTDPCASFGTGKLIQVDAFNGKMLNYAVLDTNGDGLLNSLDTVSSGVIFTGGIPTLSAVVSANGATNMIVNDSGGGITDLLGKSVGGSRRIMWRQIQ
ncbi:pilus assembly protein [Pseudomonas fluorescens]|uniref:Pilus assembly protein n=1 Tax=Pseudomonas fluorescens TaxID=294 RepID=A0A944DDN8_PSEFL|nr:PilC/PilY family type IV pilus protein [Pseudomonas fluorescens]MBT2297937.1 pilus assembly protein [Pseudomonas fluorescens]MBT2310239.1 pilus assembly protein [Pseudomonas fluorescens]MBT2315357.1 pilus assembly protein [Pseudomonas fluorescens]MBT2320427.1 pilus assembly protein [Pseudomonas fluorescens]MBT2327301.1 pilus assembly protein [Pseudomonas fluorescens]